MSTTPAFVPVSHDEARRLRDGDDLGPVPAHVPGPALREAHDLGPADDEEAGFVALGYAGLAALLEHEGPRTVLAAEVDANQVQGSGGDFGQVELQGLRWDQVSAVFADEPGAAADLETARGLAGGRTLAEVADDEEVVGLVDRWDLLWYAPEELDATHG